MDPATYIFFVFLAFAYSQNTGPCDHTTKVLEPSINHKNRNNSYLSYVYAYYPFLVAVSVFVVVVVIVFFGWKPVCGGQGRQGLEGQDEHQGGHEQGRQEAHGK